MKMYEERRGLSFALAVMMHLAIAGLLYFGVQWQTKPAAPVEVELWSGAPEPAPRQAKIETPKPRPAPKPPEPKEEPEPPTPPRKADIEEPPPKKVKPVEKKPEPKPEPKKPEKPQPKKLEPPPLKPEPKPRPEPKPDPKPEPKKPPAKLEEQGEKPRDVVGKLRSEANDNSASLSALAARQQAAEAGEKASAFEAYLGQVRNKIRRNMIYDGQGNPEVLIEVKLLPDMTILDVRVIRSSGDSVFDEAVKRAIQRTAEYPRLPGGVDFNMLRRHTLKYRAND